MDTENTNQETSVTNTTNTTSIDIDDPNDQQIIVADRQRQSPSSKYQFKYRFFAAIRNHIWLFPFAVSLSIPILCFSVYISAIHHGHLEPLLPFVSDAGTRAPQAAFFAQINDIMAILTIITTIGRYKQLKYYIDIEAPQRIAEAAQKSIPHSQTNSNNDDQPKKVWPAIDDHIDYHPIFVTLNRNNFIASLIAYANCFNLLVIGNFRCSEAYTLHTMGATAMFVGIIVYGCLMATMASQLYSRFGIESRPVSITTIVVLGTISFVGCYAFNMVSMAQFGLENFFDNQLRLHWNRSDAGYWSHVAGTGFEWLTIYSFPLLFLCIARRMRQFDEWAKVKF